MTAITPPITPSTSMVERRGLAFESSPPVQSLESFQPPPSIRYGSISRTALAGGNQYYFTHHTCSVRNLLLLYICTEREF